MEIERQKHDGTTIPCVVTSSPLMDEGGHIIGIIEQFRDISEQQQMKKQVKETEDRYKALIELGTEAGEAIVMLQDIDEAEGIQTFFNDQWPKLIGYTKKELLGTSFFKLVHHDDRQASVTRHRQKMSGKTVPGIYEMKLIRNDGVEIFVELTGAYTTYQGERANVMFIRDVTERKQTEIKLALSENNIKPFLKTLL
jgi:PAS domain S-box-containing protein